MRESTVLKPGDEVRIRSIPDSTGVVTQGPRRSGARIEYEVFIGGLKSWYSSEHLSPIALQREFRWVRDRESMLRELLISKLRHPLTEGLYAYRASRTEFLPYQFRPVLRFFRGHSQGILIADEVGLGKTIEAGIIYLELKARLDISRVLVLCPSRLTHKWQQELRQRFGEHFEILDSNGVRNLMRTVETHGLGNLRAIVSIETLRRRDTTEKWEELGIPLDLLIVDEAHYLRNESNLTHRLGISLSNNADAIVFLSATPLHLGSKDLFNLLRLLAPDQFPSLESFDQQIAPNTHVTRASSLLASKDPLAARDELRKVEQLPLRKRFTNDPVYHEALDTLGELGRTRDSWNTETAVALQRDLFELNALASVFTRTRKREMADAAVRAASTVWVEFTDGERQVYDAILSTVRSRMAKGRKGALAFGAVMPERQAASCLPAALLKMGKDGSLDALFEMDDFERTEFDLLDPESDSDGQPMDPRSGQSGSAGRIPIGLREDSKLRKFRQILEETVDLEPGSKMLVFSYFKGTLEYLRDALTREGRVVEMIHGDVKLDDRRRIIEQFKEKPDIQILLSSEVGAEGLDFQFCSILVNYDLPWNPMQVEQRIGRLDRFGQRAERIRIFNLMIADTIEERVFARLYNRIGIFERSIGELEAILGEVVRDLTREVIQENLTARELESRAESAAHRIETLRQEQNRLEESMNELLGQGQLLDQQIASATETGLVISAQEVAALLVPFLRECYPGATLVLDDEEPCATLSFDPKLKDEFNRFLNTEHLGSLVGDALKRALNGGKLAFTFDSDLARERPNLEFVTLNHPLTLFARQHWLSNEDRRAPAGAFQIQGEAGEKGPGYFAVFLLETRAVRPLISLEPMILLETGELAPRTAKRVLKALQEGSVEWTKSAGVALDTALDMMQDHVASLCRDREEREERRNDALLVARSEVLQASFEAKIKRTEQIRDAAADPRIIRMEEGEIKKLEARRDSKLNALESQRAVSVSNRLIAAGRVVLT